MCLSIYLFISINVRILVLFIQSLSADSENLTKMTNIYMFKFPDRCTKNEIFVKFMIDSTPCPHHRQTARLF